MLTTLLTVLSFSSSYGMDYEQNPPPAKDGSRFFDWACRGNHTILAKIFNLDDNPDSDGCTHLHRACINGHNEIVSMLLKKGADKDRADNMGRTPLHLAVAYNHLPVVDILIKAQANANKTNNMGQSPVHIAAILPHTDILERLLREGDRVNKNITDNNGDTPLCLAISFQRNNSIRMLIAAGGDVNLALHNACISYPEFVDILLRAGADVNQPDRSGQTPLHYAVRGNNIDAVKRLLAAGAKKDAIYNSRTPFLIAQELRNWEIIALMELTLQSHLLILFKHNQ